MLHGKQAVLNEDLHASLVGETVCPSPQAANCLLQLNQEHE